jgi:hypothetical protein
MITKCLFLSILLLGSTGESIELDSFVGTWETKKSSVTGKSNITLNVKRDRQRIIGTVVFVNPDRSILTMDMLDPVVHGKTLKFRTILTDDVFNWRFTVNDSVGRAHLIGSDQRTTKWARSRGSEMLIEEQLTRSRKLQKP